jgi:hypothetical protein
MVSTPDQADDDGLTVLVVGAGAVRNAWDPVLRALRHYHGFDVTPDGANSFLARLVYLLRWHATVPGPEKQHLEVFPTTYRDVCQKIRAELRLAQEKGELRVHPEFTSVVRRFLNRGSRFAVINTNWDTVVDKALSSLLGADERSGVEAAHLHGSVWNDSPLYLPSELMREPYRQSNEYNFLGGLHLGAMNTLDRARRVVLYGVSISPLDAELCQTLASGWDNPTLESIEIVVPDHEVVAHRANLMLDLSRGVQVRGYDPRALHAKTNYTIPPSVAQGIVAPDV